MRNRNREMCAVASGILFAATLAPGQVSTWIGGDTPVQARDWNLAAHWDTGVVPNSPTIVAVVNSRGLAGSFPVGSISISSSTVDLAELRFGTSSPSGPDAGPMRVAVTAPFALPPVGSILRLHGAGLTTADGTPYYIVSVGMGSQLHFNRNASISGNNVGVGMDGPQSGFAGVVEFHDRSSAGSASISMVGSGSGSVTFRDQSTAASATLQADRLTFADRSSAGSATISTYAYGATIRFQDRSSADRATINLARYGGVVFVDDATTGDVTVICSLESAGVEVRDRADVSGLTVRSLVYPNSPWMGGSLNISGASGDVMIRGIDGAVAVNLGANTLILGPAGGEQTLGGLIDGSGGLVLDTGRQVNLTRAGNRFTGATRVLSGTLNLAGGRASRTTVAAGARLSGSGTIDGGLVNAGTVLPGDSPGAIVVAGDFRQITSGVFAIRVNSPTDLGRLTVTGVATLAGTLALTGTNGLAPAGSITIPVLTAGAVDGRFDQLVYGGAAISGLGAARTARLAYFATGVSLQVNQAAFSGFGATPRAVALGAHLDATLGGASGDYLDLVGRLNSLATAGEVASALEALAPDRYALVAENAFLSAVARWTATDRWLAAARVPRRDGPTLFFEGGRSTRAFRAADSQANADSRVDRGTAGGLWSRGPMTWGFALSSETGGTDLDADGSVDEFRSVTPAIFVRHETDRVFLHAGMARADERHRMRRRIVHAGLDRLATARASGSRVDLGFTAGIPCRRGDWSITPLVGLLASTFKVDDFAESHAGGAGMAISGWSHRSLRSRLGLEVAATAGSLTPHLALHWWREFEDDRSLTARFTGASGGYSAPGRRAESDLLEASLSVCGPLGGGAVGHLGVDAAQGRRSRIRSELTAGIRWPF